MGKEYIVATKEISLHDWGGKGTVEGEGKLIENQPVEAELLDQETFETIKATVILFRPPDPDGDKAYLRKGRSADKVDPEPWGLKIIQSVEAEVPQVESKKKEIGLGKRRGFMIRSLLEEREKEEKCEI